MMLRDLAASCSSNARQWAQEQRWLRSKAQEEQNGSKGNMGYSEFPFSIALDAPKSYSFSSGSSISDLLVPISPVLAHIHTPPPDSLSKMRLEKKMRLVSLGVKGTHHLSVLFLTTACESTIK